MPIVELIVIAIGLSADAFAVSVCKGLADRVHRKKTAVFCGSYFGGFQAIMPILGFVLGAQFADRIAKIDHWITFVLLGLIGINMIRESGGEESENERSDSTDIRTMLLLAVATSIDALAVGVTFAFLKVNILMSAAFIGITTFGLSVIGVVLGVFFGSKLRQKAQIVGGVILVLMGFRILISHLIG